MPVFVSYRSKSVGRNGEWTHVTRSQWSGKSLQSHQPSTLSADGGAGGSQCPGHHIRYHKPPFRGLCAVYRYDLWSHHHSLSFTGKKNKLRVYYLSWLRNRILHNDPEVEKKQGWITVGDLEGCVHYKVGRFPKTI